MSILVWIMMGIALWHFTVFVPDHFWGGIVGAFLVAILGAFLSGLILNGFSIPSQDDTNLIQGLLPIPGCLAALAASWWYGKRKNSNPEENPPPKV